MLKRSIALGDSLYDSHAHLVNLTEVNGSKGGHGSHHHHHEGEDDPHFFHSPKLVLKTLDIISKWVMKENLQNPDVTKDCVNKAREHYKKGLKEVEEIFSAIPNNERKIILKHQFLGQFVDDFNFKVLQLAGFSSQERVSPKRLRKVLSEAKKLKVFAVFVEKGESRKTVSAFLEQDGAVFGGELWADNLGEKSVKLGILLKCGLQMRVL